MTNHYLNGTGLDVQACKTAVDAAKATCAAASAHGIKTSVYLSTAVLPLAMLCFFFSRFTIKADVDHSQTTPAQPMTTARLSAYMFVAGALPGYFLARASAMFFKPPPAHFDLIGLAVGGLIGVVVAVMVASAGRPKTA